MSVQINDKELQNPFLRAAILIGGLLIVAAVIVLILPIVGVSVLAILGIVGVLLLVLAISLPIIFLVLKKKVGADININFNKSDFLHKKERANDFEIGQLQSVSLIVPKGDIYIKRHEYNHLHLHCSSHNTYFRHENEKLNLVIDSETNATVNLYLPEKQLPLYINLGTGKCVIDDNPTNDFHLNLGKGSFEAYKFKGDTKLNIGMGELVMEYRELQTPTKLSINAASTKARVYLRPNETISVSNTQILGHFNNDFESSKDGRLQVKINTVKSNIQIIKAE